MNWVGTSGWFYHHWRGHLYPEDLKKAGFFAYYAERYSTVEINATFYRVPGESMVKGWLEKAPADFVFSVKGSRLITHIQRLQEPQDRLRFFFERIEPMRERLGAVLWQLPPSMQRDDDRLACFLEALPQGYRHAVEFRHKSWLEAPVFELLRGHKVAFCALSLPKFPAVLVRTAPFIYVRFHGAEARYADHYTQEELSAWGDKMEAALAPGVDAYCYFNNDIGGHAVRDAVSLREILKARGLPAR